MQEKFYNKEKHIEEDLKISGFDSIKDFLENKDVSLEEEYRYQKLQERASEVLPEIKSFIEEKIKNNQLLIFNNHGHLGYRDGQFWGHYIFPVPGGVKVRIYFEENIIGDPMDIEGSRGESTDLFVPLDFEYRKKLSDFILKGLEEERNDENHRWSDWDDRAENAAYDILKPKRFLKSFEENVEKFEN